MLSTAGTFIRNLFRASFEQTKNTFSSRLVSPADRSGLQIRASKRVEQQGNAGASAAGASLQLPPNIWCLSERFQDQEHSRGLDQVWIRATRAAANMLLLPWRQGASRGAGTVQQGDALARGAAQTGSAAGPADFHFQACESRSPLGGP